MVKVALLLTIGVTIGMASGALGIGGGVLLLPALIWLYGMEPRTAAGTTLAVLVVPVVLPAVLKYAAEKHLDLVAALWLAGGFAAGSYVGAYLVFNQLVPDQALRLAFGLLMMYVAARFLIASDSEATTAAAGLSAVLLGWLGYVGLRVVGRRYAPRPGLAEQMRVAQEQHHGDHDYSI